MMGDGSLINVDVDGALNVAKKGLKELGKPETFEVGVGG
ncbi:MAG: hypothetical protein BTN85_1810 [Candidatus Methanohalarchaeum thermophilum]|uniref:Uncharacterized protein n=1 Tax=Methanohalarchaeum thermophilum TaxID=1903181 RepID=A0A1Q6DS42_METT1|nr:MAG: hypothetical protein BTN85_1810 [Candidatus Methanohalarchaeum thermophilum]